MQKALSSVALPLCAVLVVACEAPTDPQRSGSPRMLWTHTDAAGGRALPHADAELAVFTTAFDRRVVAVDTRTGARRWERRLNSGPQGANLPFGNILAFEDLILVPGWDLYALDRKSGHIRWQYAPPEEYPAGAPIALSGDRVFSPGTVHLHAVNARTGAPVWSTPVGERPFAPVVDDGVVYVGTRGFVGTSNVLGAGHVIAIDASSGSVLWREPIPDEPGTPWRGGVNKVPALTPELVVVASSNSRLYGLDRRTGSVRWTYRGPGPYRSGAAILNGVAVAASQTGEIVGVDAATGAFRWRTTTGGSSVSEQITTDGHCAYISVGGIMCIDATGAVRWDVGGGGRGGPDYFSAVRALGNRIFVGSSSGFHALDLPR